jgi:predicted TIM-barrel fold metal-dependent hydrolase
MINSTMVIDFHSHIYPGKIAAKAVTNIGAFYNLPMQGSERSKGGGGTPEALAEEGRRGGVDHFVVFSAAGSAGQVASINNFIAAACRERAAAGGKPGFTGMGTMHPDLEKPGEELERLMSLGLKGIKLHPDMQKFNIDDERMMKIYAQAEGKLPFVFHTGDYRFDYSHPARLARVMDAFPRLTVVAAHFGGWSVYDLALEYFKDRRCYMDVSSAIPYLGHKRAVELIRIYGAERFLFGSDYPMWDPGDCLKEFLELDLTDAERERILWGTAKEILPEL